LHNLESKKRQILDRLDILKIVSEHVALKRNGRRWVGLCCFHSEKTPSFTVNPDMGIFKCFGCGKGGDVFSFVQLRENVPFRDAFEMLAEKAGVVLDDFKAARTLPGEPSRNDLAAVNVWAAKFFRANLQNQLVGLSAREYVQKRQISSESSELFGLGLAPETGASLVQAAVKFGFGVPLLLAADLCRKGDDGQVYETFRNRLMFPIRDATGRVLGFGGRTLGDHPAKYINTRQTALFDKGRGLYGLDQARNAIGKSGRAIVVEGYTDCIACHQHGFTETVATLGTAMTEDHVGLLRRYTDEVILLFDSDQAGISAADRAINLALPHGLRVRMARVPSEKDPSEFLTRHGSEAFSSALNDAADALEFKWLETRRRLDADSSNARRRDAVVEFLGVVAAAQRGNSMDAVQRGLIVNQIAHLIGIEASEVRRLFQKHSANSRGRDALAAKEGEKTQQAKPAAIPSGEQRAWECMLGVLLNDPTSWRTVTPRPNPQLIDNERDRRLANVMLQALEEGSEVSLPILLSRFEDPADVGRLTDLAYDGVQRGNYEATLRAAVERISRGNRVAEVERCRLQLRTTPPQGGDGENGKELLEAVNQGLREHRHFAPRRMIRMAAGGSADESHDG